MQFPPALHESIARSVHIDKEALIATHEQERTPSVRLHSKKMDVELCKSLLPLGNPIPWSTNGFWLQDKKYSFKADPLWHGGAYYVQEASSMFLDFALRSLQLNHPLQVMDLCAAPGGKSIILYDYLQKDDIFFANEAIPKRQSSLQENIIKWGMQHLLITNWFPEKMSDVLNKRFDVVLADVPCSGSGLFRKKKEYVHEWSEQIVHQCVQRQKQILRQTERLVKVGGILMYCTCSYSTEENEDMIEHLIDNGCWRSVGLHIPNHWGVVETTTKLHQAKGYRFFPHLSGGEGFFLAILQKDGDRNASTFLSVRKKDMQAKTANSFLSQPIKKSMLSFDDQSFDIFSCPQQQLYVKDSNVYAFSDTLAAFLQQYGNVLRPNLLANKIGRLKNGLFIPSHEWAMKMDAEHMGLPYLTINKKAALDFIAGGASIDEDTHIHIPKNTWFCIAYEGLILGFMKKTSDGSLKNYYPSAWANQV